MKPLRFFFYVALVRPLAHLCLGFNVRNISALPADGPIIIAPNHNSHLDALVISALLPISASTRIRPVVAADYFFRSPLRAWLSTNILGALPLSRTPSTHAPDPLAPLDAAIAQGDILIIFPEGSRGIPEQRSALKSGIIHLLKRAPGTPVLPVFMHGLGKALPRGERIPVPFFCDVIVGEPLLWNNDRNKFMTDLEATLDQLARQLDPKPWR